MSVVADVRAAVRNTVRTVLRGWHGPEGLTDRPLWPGAETTAPEPANWIEAVRAARLLVETSNSVMVEFACSARADGHTWDEVAEALGLTEDDGAAPAVRAFEWAMRCWAASDASYLAWECATCGKRVQDHGPYYADPQDVERGHALDCARWRRAIEAYRGEA